MDKLELFIKKLNLIFTKTLGIRDLLDNEINSLKQSINYDNCLSLYDLIIMFNKLHRSLIKEYIELGNDIFESEKYNFVYHLYSILNNGDIFNDGTYSLSSKIFNNDSFLNCLNNLTLSLKCFYYHKTSDSIIICIDLKDEFSIKTNKCQLIIDDNIINMNEDEYLKILKSIYLNASYLNSYWDRVFQNEKIKVKGLVKRVDSI